MVDLTYIKPSNLWYVVGLIATDGNLPNDGRHINITSKDKSLLDEVKKALFLNNKLTLKSSGSNKEKNYFFLQFGDIRFYNFLVKIGVGPKKSLTLNKVTVPKKYFIDFIRGVIDGDGNISTWVHKSNGNIQWSLRIFSGSLLFSEWLKLRIEKKFGVKGKIYSYLYKGKKNPIHIIKFGKFAAKVILKSCYYNDCLKLKRKSDKALECLMSENKMKKYGEVIINARVV